MSPTRTLVLVTLWQVAVCAYLLRRAVGDYGWRGAWRSPLAHAAAFIVATIALVWLVP